VDVLAPCEQRPEEGDLLAGRRLGVNTREAFQDVPEQGRPGKRRSGGGRATCRRCFVSRLAKERSEPCVLGPKQLDLAPEFVIRCVAAQLTLTMIGLATTNRYPVATASRQLRRN
jgi:hypothetical protein